MRTIGVLLRDVVGHIGWPVSSRAFSRNRSQATNYEWSCGCFGTRMEFGGTLTWQPCLKHAIMAGALPRGRKQ